jgi:hypothetical protein
MAPYSSPSNTLRVWAQQGENWLHCTNPLGAAEGAVGSRRQAVRILLILIHGSRPDDVGATMHAQVPNGSANYLHRRTNRNGPQLRQVDIMQAHTSVRNTGTGRADGRIFAERTMNGHDGIPRLLVVADRIRVT